MENLMNVLSVMGGIFGLCIVAVLAGKIFGEKGMKIFTCLLVVFFAVAYVYFLVFHPMGVEFYNDLRYFKP